MPHVDRRILVISGLALVLLVGAAVWVLNNEAVGDRQEAVAERGQGIMGFDLGATAHIFTPTDAGGVEEVVARAPRPGGDRRHPRPSVNRGRALVPTRLFLPC